MLRPESCVGLAGASPVWVGTGNAAVKFRQIDHYVVGRLHRLMRLKRGRNLRAGQSVVWTEEWFDDQGLYRLRGTVRYPKAA